MIGAGAPLATLRARWRALASRVSADATADEAGEELLRRWSEPHRRYHGPAHLLFVLEEVDLLLGAREVSAVPVVASLAAWYHDAVYDTRAKDSEERSALLLEEHAARFDLAPDVVRRAAVAVRLSDHRSGVEPSGEEEMAFLDADLAVLAEPEPAFDQYEAGVREEYAWVPEPAWREGRRALLEAFVARPTIFLGTVARRRHEVAARRNLARSLARLAPVPACPRCGSCADASGAHAPFCSERCRLLDFGAWMRGDYTVSRGLRPSDLPDAPEDEAGPDDAER